MSMETFDPFSGDCEGKNRQGSVLPWTRPAAVLIAAYTLESRALKVSCLVEDEARVRRCSVAAHEKADANLGHWAPGCKGSWLWPRDPIHKNLLKDCQNHGFGIDPLS
jgi:hypothetical protein